MRFLICARRVREQGQRLTSKRVIRSRKAERAGANNIGSYAPALSSTLKHLPCHSCNSGWDWRKVTKEGLGVVGDYPNPEHAQIFGLMQDSTSFVFFGRPMVIEQTSDEIMRSRDPMSPRGLWKVNPGSCLNVRPH